MILHKYYWVINLIGIAMSAYLLADIAGQVMMERVRHTLPSVVREEFATEEKPELRYNLSHYNMIADKNIFTKKMDDGLAKTVVKEAGPGTRAEEQTAPLTTLNLRLVGTTLLGGKGYMAFLEDLKTKKQSEYRIGDMINSDTKLVRIEREFITIERNGKREIVEYPPYEEQKKGRVSKTRGRKKQSGTGVSNVSEQRWVLEKRYVDEELKNMGKLMTQIRAVPSGKEGFKVFNIMKGSLFEKIGLKNGDLVKRINGVELSSPDKAIEMYQQLQGATDVQVDIMRAGIMQTFSYSIQ